MIADIVRERGPLTVAAFMDLVLYDPELGYYARAARRSGRAGDFFTSVDVGPLFGELLAVQIAEMADLLASGSSGHSASSAPSASSEHFDLVEAGAGNGRLAADVLGALQRIRPDHMGRVQLSLVEASPAARAAQAETLRGIFDRPYNSSESLPEAIDGIVFANELLDAFPVHQVVMRSQGLREVYVAAAAGPGASTLATCEAPPSTSALAEYLERLDVRLEPGWRAEINLRAVEWVRDLARRLRRGFVILIDYGHEARELYSASHSAGTLTTFTRHASGTPAPDSSTPEWLARAGDVDITSHVDFTSVRASAEAGGLTTIGFLDQTYFVLGLIGAQAAQPWSGPGRSTLSESSDERAGFRQRLALKTLLMPGGLGSTMKVFIFGKDVGRPPLAGCAYRVRAT